MNQNIIFRHDASVDPIRRVLSSLSQLPQRITPSQTRYTVHQLLDEDRFRTIDKIKTIGSTYMAAVGLIPDQKIQEDDASAIYYMSVLAELAFAFRERLHSINENSYNNFMLRIGETREGGMKRGGVLRMGSGL